METLTRRQLDVLNHIAEVIASRGVSPTHQEIATAFCVGIPSVQRYLGALRRKGFVEGKRHARRGIRLTRSRREWKLRRAWQGDFERRVGAELQAQTELGPVFAIVRERLRAWLDADRADLLVYDPQKRELRDGSSLGVDPAAASEGATAPATPGPLASLAFRRRRPQVASESDPGEAFAAERAARPGIRACAAVPVLGQGRILGVLRLDSRRPGGLDEATLTRAAMSAAVLAPVPERAVLGAELRRGIRAQAALAGLIRVVNGAGALESVLLSIYDVVARLVPADYFSIAACDGAGLWWALLERDEADGRIMIDSKVRPAKTQAGKLRSRNVRGHEALEAILDRPYFIKHRTPAEVRILEGRGPHVAKGGYTSTGHAQRRSRSLLFAPLRVGGGLVGYVSAQSYRYNAYTIRDGEDLGLVGEYIGMAVQNALRVERARGLRDARKRGPHWTDRFAWSDPA